MVVERFWPPTCNQFFRHAPVEFFSQEDRIMSGSAQPVSEPAVICCICAEPISLETTRTDERGKAVHEHCYVSKTISKFRVTRAFYPRERLYCILSGSN